MKCGLYWFDVILRLSIIYLLFYDAVSKRNTTATAILCMVGLLITTSRSMQSWRSVGKSMHIAQVLRVL